MDINVSLIITGLIALLVVVSLFKAAKVVPNQEAYVIERLGKYKATLNAGFHILIPFFDVVAYKRSLKEEVLDVPQQTCITKDNVSVGIDGVIYLQVVNASSSAYGIDNYYTGAIQLAQTSLRSAIGKLELDKTFEGRENINKEVIEALNLATIPWGIKVLRYEIKDIAPPQTVMQAMEKQMQAEREKRAIIAESEGKKEAEINRAEGEKKALIAKSEGDMTAMKNKAEGEATAIETVALATAKSIKLVAEELQSEGGQASVNFRIAEKWIEQYGNIAKEGTTMIVPQNIGDASTMVATFSNVLDTLKSNIKTS